MTRSDTAAGSGTGDFLPVKNGNAVRAALFGTGQAAGGLISATHIGGVATYTNSAGQIVHENPYPNINKILDALGINASSIAAHQNHFHIYLRPPELREIDAPSHLLADAPSASSTDAASSPTLESVAPIGVTEAQALLDYALTLIEG